MEHIPDPMQHKNLLNLVRRYLLIGGMPDAIKSSLEETSLVECVKVHNRLLQSYEPEFWVFTSPLIRFQNRLNLKRVF